jgi:hypothetical protein
MGTNHILTKHIYHFQIEMRVSQASPGSPTMQSIADQFSARVADTANSENMRHMDEPTSLIFAILLAKALASDLLGRRQAVRQRFLVPPFPGSNPGAPANFPKT